MTIYLGPCFAIRFTHTAFDKDDPGDMFFILPALFYINDEDRISINLGLFNMALEFAYVKDDNNGN